MCLEGSLGRATIICPGVPGQFPSIHANANSHYLQLCPLGSWSRLTLRPLASYLVTAWLPPRPPCTHPAPSSSLPEHSSIIPDYWVHDSNFMDVEADFGRPSFRSSTLTYLEIIHYVTARLSIICQNINYTVKYMSCIRRVPMLALVCVCVCVWATKHLLIVQGLRQYTVFKQLSIKLVFAVYTCFSTEGNCDWAYCLEISRDYCTAISPSHEGKQADDITWNRYRSLSLLNPLGPRQILDFSYDGIDNKCIRLLFGYLLTPSNFQHVWMSYLSCHLIKVWRSFSL